MPKRKRLSLIHIFVVEGELYAAWEGQGEENILHGGFGAVESKVNPTPVSYTHLL